MRIIIYFDPVSRNQINCQKVVNGSIGDKTHSFGRQSCPKGGHMKKKNLAASGIITLAAAVALGFLFHYDLRSQEVPQPEKPMDVPIVPAQQLMPADHPTAGMAGSNKCIECHSDEARVLQKTAHGIAEDPRTPAGKMGCETCHGPGLKHASDQDEKGTISVHTFGVKGNLPNGAQNQVCLQCHTYGAVAKWHSSTHDLRQVGCTNCHQVHGGHEKNLAKANQTDLCLSCHKEMRGDLHRLSRHPIEEGKVKCSDCHNAHGSTGEKMLVGNSVNETCYKCHAEKRGPFLWEHAPVAESCLNCHKPHGSTNEKLLTVRKPMLCQQCHSQSQHPATLYAQRQDQVNFPVYNSLNNKFIGMSCNNCHVNTHGSNHPSGKFFQR